MESFAERVRSLSLGIAIAALLPLILNYGLGLLAAEQLTKLYITLIYGFICIISGLFFKEGLIGFGFIIGGILSFVSGYGHFWRVISDWVMFISLVAALILIVGFALFKARK
jgi:hypothetical protein